MTGPNYYSNTIKSTYNEAITSDITSLEDFKTKCIELQQSNNKINQLISTNTKNKNSNRSVVYLLSFFKNMTTSNLKVVRIAIKNPNIVEKKSLNSPIKS